MFLFAKFVTQKFVISCHILLLLFEKKTNKKTKNQYLERCKSDSL